MENKKYLKLYEEWMVTGKVPGCNGMCDHFRGDDLFQLMNPIDRGNMVAWWASGVSEDEWLKSNNKAKIEGGFTDIRQNIVLFMAAMNGEL
ncbi:MAG TPA: hypothetical protein VFD46_14260 [Chryseolinea sp.]|nr:hypothetical protein [Chryseolinea sp.]